MSTFKKAQVVMLPTNEKVFGPQIPHFIRHLSLYKRQHPSGGQDLSYERYMDGMAVPNPQHLCFLSDEKIKEGDWVLIIREGLLLGERNEPIFIQSTRQGRTEYKRKDGTTGWFTSEVNFQKEWNYKKIIATTDENLVYLKQNGKLGQAIIHLPQPSQSFVGKFVEEYNKGNAITEVMVEYEQYFDAPIQAYKNNCNDFRLKVNPKDNTITIRKVKDSWNREEVVVLLNKLNNTLNIVDKPERGYQTLEEWIEENL